MRVEIKLFAYFRDNRFKQETFTLDTDTSVRDIVEDLHIDKEEVGIILINNRHCNMETKLYHGDSLALFPLIGGG